MLGRTCQDNFLVAPWHVGTGHVYRDIFSSGPSLGYNGGLIFFAYCGMRRDFDHRHEFEYLPEGEIFEKLFTDACFISMSSAFFRRSAIDEVGGIPAHIRMIPDYFLYLSVARRHPVRAVQDVVCYYRMH